MKPRVDDFESRIAQSTRDNFGSPIVAIESWLCDKYSDDV
jgi:hypothetical protein